MKFNVGDKVREIEDNLYLEITEYLGDNYYSTVTDMEGINETTFIYNSNDLELIRRYDDPKCIFSELAVISFEQRKKFDANFDNRIDLCRKLAKREYPNYNQTLKFSSTDNDIVTVYVLLD